MFNSKSVKALVAVLALYARSTDAFTAPKPSLATTLRDQRMSSFAPSVAQQHQPSHLSYEHSLQFFKNEQNTADVVVIQDFTAQTVVEKDEVPGNVIGFVGGAVLLFAYVIQKLQIYLNTPCLDGDKVCTEQYHLFAEFFNNNGLAAYGLVLTHAIPFALLPWVSKQVSEQGRIIKKDFPEFNPFIMQMSMACIGFGLSLEFGWHVADSWYYDNNFHVLNFGFYFFLISGFALWADGFKNNAKVDTLFFLILAVATVLYPMGNAVQVLGDEADIPGFLQGFFAGGGSVGKIPLYIGMTATFASITLRGREVFGKDMYIVAFLSVVVNLSFIFLLNGYAYADQTSVDELNILNYVYHICHDVLGTEAGVLYFGILVKNYVPLSQRLESDSA